MSSSDSLSSLSWYFNLRLTETGRFLLAAREFREFLALALGFVHSGQYHVPRGTLDN